MRLIDADAIPYELWITEVEVDKSRNNGTYHYFQNRYMVDRRAIEAMPSIESRPKGKWIYTHGDYFRVRCGVCGFANQCEDNFCPKCGADMRKQTNKGETHDQ